MAARIMRRILIDYARSRPKGARTELTETLAIAPQMELDPVLLDQALKALAEFDERKAKVVEMKFFGGLTIEEIAAVLNVSKQTIDRDWSLAKAWLILRDIGEARFLLTEGSSRGRPPGSAKKLGWITSAVLAVITLVLAADLLKVPGARVTRTTILPPENTTFADDLIHVG
jgi:hypothetical protein